MANIDTQGNVHPDACSSDDSVGSVNHSPLSALWACDDPMRAGTEAAPPTAKGALRCPRAQGRLRRQQAHPRIPAHGRPVGQGFHLLHKHRRHRDDRDRAPARASLHRKTPGPRTHLCLNARLRGLHCAANILGGAPQARGQTAPLLSSLRVQRARVSCSRRRACLCRPRIPLRWALRGLSRSAKVRRHWPRAHTRHGNRISAQPVPPPRCPPLTRFRALTGSPYLPPGSTRPVPGSLPRGSPSSPRAARCWSATVRRPPRSSRPVRRTSRSLSRPEITMSACSTATRSR